MAAFKTKTRSNTMKPIFGEAFAFQVTDRDEPCIIQLFDSDPMDADDLIGQVSEHLISGTFLDTEDAHRRSQLMVSSGALVSNVNYRV
jgi:Ca2+-dependent lipid-binding protein|eukprot:COSAG06_NODE_186_length_20792_cov_1041.487443_7_plen_88_part_00